MQKFYTAIRSMPNGSEHTRVIGDMTRREALIHYSEGLRFIAVTQALGGNESSMQLYEDGILLRSDTIEAWCIRQDKLAH